MIQALKHQVKVTSLLIRTMGRLLTDERMNSRMSFKSFGVYFTGMVMHEGITNPRLTCEDVAEKFLGKGHHTALAGRVAVVTGASSGLGLETARVLRKYGCHVVCAVLESEIPGLMQQMQVKDRRSGTHTIIPLDLGDLTTIRPFVEEFAKLNLPLCYLINNAGIMSPKEFRPSKQGYEAQFAINHLGHFLLTELLAPHLLKTKTSDAASDVRIITLSSVGSTLIKPCDLDKLIPPPREMYHGAAEYGISKAMNLFHSRELQKRYGPQGITCCALHPGVIHTGLLREDNPDSALLYDLFFFKPFHRSTPEGAATHMHCTLSPEVPKEVKAGACFYYNCRPQRALGVAAPGVRDDLCSKVWKISEDLVAPYR